MHLVDHEDLEASDHRLVSGLLEQLRDFIDAAIGRRIEFRVVDEATGVDIAAGLALTTRLSRDTASAVAAQAVQRLGQDA